MVHVESAFTYNLGSPKTNSIEAYNGSSIFITKLYFPTCFYLARLHSCTMLYVGIRQCVQIWLNTVSFASNFNCLAIFLWVYLVFGKILNLLWHIFKMLGKFSLFQTAKMLDK